MAKSTWANVMLFVLVVSLVLLTNGCQDRRALLQGVQSPLSTPMSKSTTISVELLVFSGVTNPRWALSATQLRELLVLVNQLPVTASTSHPDQLGYSGFLVQIADPEFEISSVKTFRSIVAVTANGQVVYRQDSPRAIERWLLRTARLHIDQELYDLIADELNKDEEE